MRLQETAAFLDKYLAVKRIPDDSRNGLQVRGRPRITTVAFAVDACMDVFLKAKNIGADMIVVHHGLFWKGGNRKNPVLRKRLDFLKRNKMSLYAAHLPLDMHKESGNSAVIARILGLRGLRPFGEYEGVICGLSGTLPKRMARDAFRKVVEEKIGRIQAKHFFGQKSVRKVGVVSGGGSFAVEEMKKAGIDMLVSGEPEHKAYHNTLEAGVNVLYAGHYSTERFGVMALSGMLKKEFPELKTKFIDSPTGL